MAGVRQWRAPSFICQSSKLQAKKSGPGQRRSRSEGSLSSNSSATSGSDRLAPTSQITTITKTFLQMADPA